MNDMSRVFYLNNRQLFYTRRESGNFSKTVEKKITEIPQGKDFVAGVQSFPVVVVKSEQNGEIFSYKNNLTFQYMEARKNPSGAYTVTIPVSDGKINVGYIKDGKAIPWTKHKDTQRLMSKLAGYVRKGL